LVKRAYKLFAISSFFGVIKQTLHLFDKWRGLGSPIKNVLCIFIRMMVDYGLDFLFLFVSNC